MLHNLLHGVRIGRLTVVIMSIAVVAVGGLLAYVGFSSDNNSVSVYSGDSSESLQLRGSVFARCGEGDSVKEVVFTVVIPKDTYPVNFSAPPDNVIIISYKDSFRSIENVPWKVKEYVAGDGDDMLEAGETFLVTGLIGEVPGMELGANTAFTIEVKTSDGEVLVIRRATPGDLLPVMNLG